METKKELASIQEDLFSCINTAISLLHLWEERNLLGTKEEFENRLLCNIPENLHETIRQANQSIEDKSDITSHSFFMEVDKLTFEVFGKYVDDKYGEED